MSLYRPQVSQVHSVKVIYKNNDNMLHCQRQIRTTFMSAVAIPLYINKGANIPQEICVQQCYMLLRLLFKALYV